MNELYFLKQLKIITKKNQCAAYFHGFLPFFPPDNVLMEITEMVMVLSSQLITIGLFSTVFTASVPLIPIATI